MTEGGAAGSGNQMLHLPFAVDDHYVPYGYMGAGEEALKEDPNDCATRPEGAQGDCHRYDYAAPTESDQWAGIFWLTTYDNWGDAPGWPVEAGAERVVFRAASDPPGAPLEFFVGLASELEYSDLFHRAITPALTTEMEEFSIELSGASYSTGVLGGFGFSLASPEEYTIFLDDIRWE
jgi:hypothetical protein